MELGDGIPARQEHENGTGLLLSTNHFDQLENQVEGDLIVVHIAQCLHHVGRVCSLCLKRRDVVRAILLFSLFFLKCIALALEEACPGRRPPARGWRRAVPGRERGGGDREDCTVQLHTHKVHVQCTCTHM